MAERDKKTLCDVVRGDRTPPTHSECVLSLDEETLGDAAQKLGSKFFRAGLLLGLQPYELDNIQAGSPHQNLWQMNMQMLNKWRQRVSAEAERLQLAQVLKQLGLGRMASIVDSRVLQDPGPETFINPSNPSFTPRELEEISRDVGGNWERLGVYLHISDHNVREIKHRNEDISVQAFRCLWAWYETGDRNDRKTLADALRKIHRGRLASKITN